MTDFCKYPGDEILLRAWDQDRDTFDQPRIKQYPFKVIFWERIGSTLFMMAYFATMLLDGLHGELGFGVPDNPGADSVNALHTPQGSFLVLIGFAAMGYGALWIVFHILRKIVRKLSD